MCNSIDIYYYLFKLLSIKNNSVIAGDSTSSSAPSSQTLAIQETPTTAT